MLRPLINFAVVLLFALVPSAGRAQQAEAPVYKEGDWWRVKVDVARPTGVSTSGPQLGGFPEYIVKVESGNPKVFGIRDDLSKELNAPAIVSLVLGKAGWKGELLRFPMRVGLTWSDRFQFQPRGAQVRWEEGRYEVHAWEKTRTPKTDVDAFKIVMTMSVPTGPKGRGSAPRTSTYYYAPDIKAIVSFSEDGTEAAVNAWLVEFNVTR
jgi:hypothetical protein